MRRRPLRRVPVMAMLLLGLSYSPAAQASDFSGMVTMIIGVPALLLLNAVLGMMLIARPTSTVRIWAGLLGVPVLLVGFLLWGDAASLFRPDDHTVFGVTYFVLYAIGVALLVRHFTRREAPAVR